MISISISNDPKPQDELGNFQNDKMTFISEDIKKKLE